MTPVPSPAIRTVLTAVATALLLLLQAPPADAQPHRLEFSRDGLTWTTTPPASIFARDVTLAPGGSATAVLHLRSTAPTVGELEVAITDAQATDPAAAEAFGISVTTDDGTGEDGARHGLPRTRFADLAECTAVGNAVTLAPGESAQVALSIDLDAQQGGNLTQQTAVGMGLSLTFTDAAAGSASCDAPDEKSPGAGTPADGSAGGDPSDTTDVIPVLPSDGTQESDPAGSVGRQGGETGRPGASAEGLFVVDGPLAATGFSRPLLVLALVVTGIGALLLAIRRRKGERS